jgi:hypothetical protein
MYPIDICSKREQALRKKSSAEQKDFFNAHISLRTDLPNALFIDKAEFLIQSMIVQTDDELLGYVYRFYSSVLQSFDSGQLLAGMHKIFLKNEDVPSDATERETTEVNAMIKKF